MLTAYKRGEQVLISSVELSDALNIERRKYYLFIRRFVLQNASLKSPQDYFLYKKAGWRGYGQPNEYLFSTTLAKAILIAQGTAVSAKIRSFIETEIETGKASMKKKVCAACAYTGWRLDHHKPPFLP